MWQLLRHTINQCVPDPFKLLCTVLKPYMFPSHLDRECFIETVAEYLLDVISTEDLQLLLTEEETWKHFVAEVDLSRSSS